MTDMKGGETVTVGRKDRKSSRCERKGGKAASCRRMSKCITQENMKWKVRKREEKGGRESILNIQ